MALWDNIQGRWKLANTTYTDTSGNGNTLIAYNSPVATTGHDSGTNTATDFERSSSQYLAITDANQTGLDITGNLTISAWVKVESSVAGEYKMILCKIQSTSEGYYLFDVEPDMTIKFRVVDSSLSISQTFSSTSLSTGIWYHLVGTYDGVNLRIYINGVLDGTPASHTTGIGDNIGDFTIGNQPSTSHYFDGVIDDVCVWSRALSATEIASLYGLGDDFVGKSTISATVRDSLGNAVDCSTYNTRVICRSLDGDFDSTQLVTTADGSYTINSLIANEEYYIINAYKGTHTPTGDIDPAGAAILTAS